MRKLVRTVRNAFRYGEAGFTLIELLVVIGILAALAGVVTLAVTQFIGRGATEACATDKHNCQTAVAGWMVDHPGVAAPANCTALVGTYVLDSPLVNWGYDTGGRINSGTCPH